MDEQNKLFDDPRNLITDESVRKAVQNDKKGRYDVKCWTVKDFTKKGDNYSSFVTGVEVHIEDQDTKKTENVSYVAKINPCRNSEGWNGISNVFFAREGRFLYEVLPEFNQVLASLDKKPLSIPKCYHLSLEEGKEIMLNEDLRRKGFVMTKRKECLDFGHLSILMENYAKLHACSYIQEKMQQKGIAQIYPFMEKNVAENDNSLSYKMFQSLLVSQMSNALKMLEEIGMFKEAKEILENLRLNAMLVYNTPKSKTQKFRAIIHGDCWSNNFLFKYNSDLRPIESMLLDFQVSRICSFAIDLNHVLFSSLSLDKGSRLKEIPKLLRVYFERYESLVERAGLKVPFTFQELKEEFDSNNPFGFLLAIFMLPISSLDNDDLLDIANMADAEEAQRVTEHQSLRLVELVKEETPFRRKFLTLMEEMVECNRKRNFFPY